MSDHEADYTTPIEQVRVEKLWGVYGRSDPDAVWPPNWIAAKLELERRGLLPLRKRKRGEHIKRGNHAR